MSVRNAKSNAPTKPRPRPAASDQETWQEQIASFVGFFVYLLILKTFFLPLFIIPTGSMAETLYGEHTIHTCPNCGIEYPVAWQPEGTPFRGLYQPVVQCPNCRWRQYYGDPRTLHPRRPRPDEPLDAPLRPMAGDRIFVHGWNFEPGFRNLSYVGPDRWDVVVFKVPKDGVTNYIKRLIGKPGEKVEIINGDVFINDEIAHKPDHAQRSLWFLCYDHDHPPKRPSLAAGYHPRWVPQDVADVWHGLGEPLSRVIRFAGSQHPRSSIQFVTDVGARTTRGRVEDVYAYNEYDTGRFVPHAVCDVRLGTEIEIDDAADDASYVEISTTKGTRTFHARLHASGPLELLAARDGDTPQSWGTWTPPHRGPLHVALVHVDGRVAVEVDGRQVLASTAEQYRITPADAHRHAVDEQPPQLRISAAGVRATLRHVRIERDVYYTSEVRRRSGEGYGVSGQPIVLDDDAYYLLGDNSPNSQDARFAFASSPEEAVGPHLEQDARTGDFQRGTVPADQLIGPAFFVYWPGFLPLTSNGPHVLPDLGRVRWIR